MKYPDGPKDVFEALDFLDDHMNLLYGRIEELEERLHKLESNEANKTQIQCAPNGEGW